MQIKWLEDFVALAQERSFTRAAEVRHVTHPAFGRRIRALEEWAGTALIERTPGPVRLTAAGQIFLETAREMTRSLALSQESLRAAAGQHSHTVTLVTGRTLARTTVADWLARTRHVLISNELQIQTTSMQEAAHALEQAQVDFALLYHHPTLALELDNRLFTYRLIAADRLVPVSRATPQGGPRYGFSSDGQVPYLAYSRSLALGRLVDDHLTQNPFAPRLQRIVECDSADAQYEYVVKGLGVAWLPWSMVYQDCKAGVLALAGDKNMEIRFDVRLYRAKSRLSVAAEAFWEAICAK